MPIFEEDGKVLAQSNAIARYLAKEYGLAGKGNWEQAEVDMYVDCVGDVIAGKNQSFQSSCINIVLLFYFLLISFRLL